jgi:CelD/BcsL family acetyltransferase involved in cellulose biosynthesis
MGGVKQMYIKTLRTFDEFLSIEDEWNDLGAENNNIFLTHLWLSEWWRIYGTKNQIFTLLVIENDHLIGILPLMIHKVQPGLKFLRFMGSGNVIPNHLDIIARAEDRLKVVTALSENLYNHRAEWDMLDLDKLPSEGATLANIRDYFKVQGLFTEMEVSARCPYIELPAQFESYMKARPHQRNFLRFQRRIARENVDIRMKCANTLEEASNVLNALITLHQERWTKRGYPGSFATQDCRDFHQKIVRRSLKAGQLRLYYAVTDSEISSICYGFRVGDTIQLYNKGFDERWARYNIGNIITAYAIEQAIQEGARYFDFLQGEERYKADWATHTRENIRLRVYSQTWRAKIWQRHNQMTKVILAWALENIPINIRRPIWKFLLRWNTKRKDEQNQEVHET